MPILRRGGGAFLHSAPLPPILSWKTSDLENSLFFVIFLVKKNYVRFFCNKSDYWWIPGRKGTNLGENLRIIGSQEAKIGGFRGVFFEKFASRRACLGEGKITCRGARRETSDFEKKKRVSVLILKQVELLLYASYLARYMHLKFVFLISAAPSSR